MAVQELLFGGRAPGLDREFGAMTRVDLGQGAWLDHHPGWVRGDDVLFDHLEATTRWHASERPRYDRIVAVPRLTASLPEDGPGHPTLLEASAALSRRYRRPVDRLSLALYRGGDDSVAFHND